MTAKIMETGPVLLKDLQTNLLQKKVTFEGIGGLNTYRLTKFCFAVSGTAQFFFF